MKDNTRLFLKYCYGTLIFFCQIIYPQEVQQQKKDTSSIILNQVTISAARYSVETLTLPYAVSTIRNIELKNTRGYGMDEVISNLPGVLAQSRAGTHDTRLIIRGFGARGAGDRSNSGTSRGIKIMIDGIPETEPDGRTSFDNIDLSLLNEIEVIRSNSSALWGNASGGVIYFSTMPDFINPFIAIKGYIGSFGFKKIAIQAASLFGGNKIYAGFSGTSFDGWRNHSSAKRSILSINLQTTMESKTRIGIFLSASGNLFHIPGPLTKSQYEKNQSEANSIYLQRDERRYNRLGKIGVTFKHAISGFNEISATAFINPKYLQRSERGTFRDFTRYYVGGSLSFNNVLQITNDISNKFTIGMEEAYQDGAVLFYSLSPENSRGGLLTTNKREGAENFGLFIQDILSPGEKLSFITGARYDRITYYSEDYLNSILGLQKKNFSRISPRAGISYKILPEQSIYLNFGSGVEVPAGNETDPAGTFGDDSVYLINPLLEPIISTTYEIGAKGIYKFNNRFIKNLTYDAALYYINIENDIIPYSGGRYYFTAGKTYRTGFEFGTTLSLLYGITFSGNVTYSKNRYTDYMVDSIHYGKPGKFGDYGGNETAGIPDFYFKAGINYEPEFLSSFYINLNINGVNKYFIDDANSIEVPSYHIFNLSIGSRKQIKLNRYLAFGGFLTINNLFGSRYISSAFINPDYINGEPVYIEPGIPRNFTLSMSFGIQK